MEATTLFKSATMIAGVYDGLTALIAERVGFSGLWAGSFAISTSRGVPDASFLSVDQLVDKVGEIVHASDLPVIVDCDEGYGSTPNLLKLVRQLYSLGVRIICLEDNAHPKTNSFYPRDVRQLVAPAAFCEKIEIVKRDCADMAVIARTESLIVGKSLQEAVERGEEYARAGADYVLLHSKYSRADDVKTLRKAWALETPLAIVPTSLVHVSFAELAALDFRLIIFANQALRVSIYAVEQAMRILATTGRQDQLPPSVSMDRVFELIEPELSHSSILSVDGDQPRQRT
jgi:phosphoenolpyruvate phosphomutase